MADSHVVFGWSDPRCGDVVRGPTLAESLLVISASKALSVVVFLSIATIGAVGCSAQTETDEEMDATESDLSGSRNVSLKYEGTCAFLKNCSTYSRNLGANQVRWGCTGVGICSDSAKWVAGPNRSYCGKTVKICKGSTCTNALVKDVSVSRDWEASNGVMDALDLPHGLSGRCSGFGGGKVTVTVGGRATNNNLVSPPDDDNDTDAGAGSSSGDSNGNNTTTPDPGTDPQGDNGCYSKTLGVDVPELTCVHSNGTGLDYQCKAGLWYRGVTGTTGRYGECLNSEIRTN